MNDITLKPRTKLRIKTERPRLYKVILVNDDFTPREFVVMVLKAEFHMTEDQAYRVMMTAHRRGVCVVAVLRATLPRPRRRAPPKPAVSRAIHSFLPPSRRNRDPAGQCSREPETLSTARNRRGQSPSGRGKIP